MFFSQTKADAEIDRHCLCGLSGPGAYGPEIRDTNWLPKKEDEPKRPPLASIRALLDTRHDQQQEKKEKKATEAAKQQVEAE